jgi:para-aminobenzoate synthetase component I
MMEREPCAYTDFMEVDTPPRFEAVPVKTPADGPLAVELIPAPDPWDVARSLAYLPNLLFLDSSERHGDRGRYSYVMADAEWLTEKRVESILDPFENERSNLARHRQATAFHLPPFQGGVAGLFGYGLGRAFEAVPAPHLDEFEMPDQFTGVYPWVISFDHAEGRAWVVATGYARAGRRRRRARAQEQLQRVLELLDTREADCSIHENPGASVPRSPQYPLAGFPGVTSTFDRAGYEAAVAKVVEYIRAGDCYQVNLSQRLLTPLREHPLELYGRLRRLNPAPFSAYFDLGGFQVLSASPERFLKVENGEVETRPIKGTRPRGRSAEEDAALIAELQTNPKDRAENVMIVDLLRNDLGRVCEYGSVRVPTICEVETFRYVHHLVSEVRGTLRPECGPLDVLRAAFPGGSVTGAPKIRAMEIISELEPTARGPYCGSLGFIGFNGSMDTNILIRTFTAGRGWLQFPVGGGIVADSEPRREYEETLHKAAGLLKALNHSSPPVATGGLPAS